MGGQRQTAIRSAATIHRLAVECRELPLLISAATMAFSGSQHERNTFITLNAGVR
jgi:hypothetical protein